MPKPTKSIIATAYHEAGHAVIAYLEDLVLREVSIVPTSDTLGHCRYAQAHHFNPEARVPPAMRARIAAHIMGSLAGPDAERRYRAAITTRAHRLTAP
jgi:ATP-dependent Zn protease